MPMKPNSELQDVMAKKPLTWKRIFLNGLLVRTGIPVGLFFAMIPIGAALDPPHGSIGRDVLVYSMVGLFLGAAGGFILFIYQVLKKILATVDPASMDVDVVKGTTFTTLDGDEKKAFVKIFTPLWAQDEEWKKTIVGLRNELNENEGPVYVVGLPLAADSTLILRKQIEEKLPRFFFANASVEVYAVSDEPEMVLLQKEGTEFLADN